MSANGTVSEWSDKVIAIVILVATIAITTGVGIMIQEQFTKIRMTAPNGTNIQIEIPDQLKIQTYTPYLSLIIMLLLISLIVGVVFGVVIPKLRGATAR